MIASYAGTGAARRRPNMGLVLQVGCDTEGTETRDRCGHIMSSAGDYTQQTAFTKFIGGAGSIPTTSGYLRTGSSADLNFGANDWTIRAFYYQFATGYFCIPNYGNASNFACYFYTNSGGGIFANGKTAGVYDWSIAAANGSWTFNQWHHLELARGGDTVYLFIDGQKKAISGATSIAGKTLYGPAGNYVWGIGNPTFRGYADEIEWYVGRCLHTESFTPPTRRR